MTRVDIDRCVVQAKSVSVAAELHLQEVTVRQWLSTVAIGNAQTVVETDGQTPYLGT